jgi:hypothetical protein
MDPARLYAASQWAKDVLSNIRTSEERLSWESNEIEALRAPGRAVFEHGIEDG